ncbi:MAG: BLUF domain-containing protein [Candidatus Lernaella stagnicola]|nr:BLUF domain-containing protein [Candidatus Lernaella stagnicola]
MKRIKYVSRFAQTFSKEEIGRLAVQSAEDNVEREITGVLMTSGGMFFQVIEGPDAVIDELYAKITGDPRHKHVLLLSAEAGVETRIFPDWAMKKVDLDVGSEIRTEPLRAIMAAIVQQRAMIDQLSGALERATWAEMVDAG